VAQLCLDGFDSASTTFAINQLDLGREELAQICHLVRSELQSRGDLFEPFPEGKTGVIARRLNSNQTVAAKEEQSKPLNVLIAEDNTGQRRLISNFVMAAGHTVMACADGSSALQTALAHQPDLVLSDFQMPGMNGVELCRALRQTAAGKAIYFILI